MNDSNISPKVAGKHERWIVKNVMSASVLPPPPGFDSRLDYWSRTTGITNPKCAHEICNRPATHGAIATKAFSSDRQRYVYPACETCTRRTEMLFADGPFVTIDDFDSSK